MLNSRTAHLRPILLALGLSAAVAGCALPHNNQVQITPLQKGTLSSETDLHLADAALNGGSNNMAITLYKKILSSTPDSQPALIGLAQALSQSNQLEDARQVYLQLETLAPQQINAELGLARISIREQHLDDAVARYQKILQRQPDTLAAEIGLGVAYDTQGKHSQAQTIYRQGILTHPYDLNLHNDLGLSLVLSGQLRAGISELSSIVDDPSAPPQTRQNLALAYGLLGNNVQAEHILQADLPQAQVQNNLQYYRFLRTRLSQPDAMPTQSPLP